MRFRRVAISILCAGALAVLPAAAVDVSQYGAQGNGVADDTAALQTAINSTAAGSVLTFGGPGNVYLISARLIFLPGRAYQGQGTIRMNPATASHTAIAKLSYGAANQVSISGITFDANGVGGGLQLAVDGGGAIPADSVTISNAIFRNTTQYPAGPWDSAIYAPVGLTNAEIANNQIVNCGEGIYLGDLNNVTISGNSFQRVHAGDAISVTFSPAPFVYGHKIQITQNNGQHLGRMGVELWPNGGNTAQTSQVAGAVISSNMFSDWDTGYDPNTFGISAMAGTATVIQNNKLMGPGGGYGIELGSAQSTVAQNTVQGFSSGIILHDCANSIVNNNLATGQATDGIEFSNAPGSRAGVVVTNNTIVDAQALGIYVNTSAWGGTTLRGNFIARAAGAYASDNSQGYTAIGITPPATPVNVVSNMIVQTATAGPSNFGFIGIRVNGGSGTNSGSTYNQNTILSYMMLTQSYGLDGNSPGSLDGASIQGNSFSGLFSASGGASSNGALISGNLIYNCAQVGPISLVL